VWAFFNSCRECPPGGRGAEGAANARHGKSLMAALNCCYWTSIFGLSPVMVKEIDELSLISTARRISIILDRTERANGLKLSSQGYVLETGKIVLSGPSGDLLNNDHVRRAYLGDEKSSRAIKLHVPTLPRSS